MRIERLDQSYRNPSTSEKMVAHSVGAKVKVRVKRHVLSNDEIYAQEEDATIVICIASN